MGIFNKEAQYNPAVRFPATALSSFQRVIEDVHVV
jgi:hypothetical protein